MIIFCLLIILVVVLSAVSWWAAPLYFQKRMQQRIDHTKRQYAFAVIPISKMRKLLQKYEPSKWISTSEERKFFDELPGKVTLYRGCCIDEATFGRYGISWTARRDVAEFFSFRYTTEQRAVFSTTISKENIRAVLTEREEAECLILEPTNVQVVTTEPTEYYDQYQKFRADYDRQEKELLAKIKEQWSDLSKNEQKKF